MYIVTRLKVLRSIHQHTAFNNRTYKTGFTSIFGIEPVLVSKKDPTLVKKRSKSSFTQELFLGKLNLDWFYPFPTLDSKEDLNEGLLLSDSVGQFFDDRVDSKLIDSVGKVDDEVMQELKKMGLFGLQVPIEYGGIGLSNLQYAQVAQELVRDGSIYMMLANHLMVVKAFVSMGSEEQKQKYLPQLASGQSIGCFCFSESPDGLDGQQVKSYAYLSQNENEWILNGEKTLVFNGFSGNTFIVFARTEVIDVNNKKVDKITAFIVERDFLGVSSGELEDKIGVRACETCSLNFDNTPIPVSNVLGEVGKGYLIAMDVINRTRYASGVYASGVLKNLMQPLTKHVSERQQFGTSLKSFGLIQKKITEIACETYAMESIAFLVAAQSEDENLDCSVEAAMVKVYSSENAWKLVSECLQVFGGLGYMKEYPFERFLRDTSFELINGGPNYLLKLYVALSSLKGTSKRLEVIVRNMYTKTSDEYQMLEKYHDRDANNLGFFPWLRSKHNPVRDRKDDDLSLNLLHPDLCDLGKMLEHCVDVFYIRLLTLIKKHGKVMAKDELLHENLCDVAVKIFVMSAVLSRCNKSLLLQLSNHQQEVELVSFFINKTFKQFFSKKTTVHSKEQFPARP